MQRNKYSAGFICKSQYIANAGYFEKKKKKQQIFVKAITCTKLSGSVLLPQDTPGYLKDTQGHPKISHDAYYFLYKSFIYSFRRKQSKKASNSFHFKCIASKKVILNNAETP